MADKYIDHMSGALQENVLTLLCFDTDAARLIRLLVDVELFDSAIYQEIASKAIAFLDQYNDAVAEHLPDVLENKLNSSDAKQARLYKRTLENLYAAKAHMNSAYITTQLQEFVHEQRFKAGLLKAYEHIEAGRISEAEVAIEDSLKNRGTSFEAGTFFADPKQSLKFFETLDTGIKMGIKELDARDIDLKPGTLTLFIGPAKKGKSWACTHVGKSAMRQRKKVVHVTLENGEELTSQRYVMSLFSVSKRESKVRVPLFEIDDSNKFMGVDFNEITRPTLMEAGIRKHIEKSMRERFKASSPLVIRQFPPGVLTVAMLEAYLDTLERIYKFIPDVLILDYPDLMKMEGQDQRMAVSEIFKGVRGILVKRKIAGFCPTQGNRSSADARTVTDTHVAEDYSKIMTADQVLTYSQTVDEKRLGLARIFVSNARGDEDKFTVLVSQAYQIGQFCLDSRLFSDNYWDVVDKAVPRQQRGEDDDDRERRS